MSVNKCGEDQAKSGAWSEAEDSVSTCLMALLNMYRTEKTKSMPEMVKAKIHCKATNLVNIW